MEFYHMHGPSFGANGKPITDRFDQSFCSLFQGSGRSCDPLEEMERWLSHALTLSDPDFEAARLLWENKSLEEIREIMSQRIKEQKEEHRMAAVNDRHGGITAFGHSGHAQRYPDQGQRRRACLKGGRGASFP